MGGLRGLAMDLVDMLGRMEMRRKQVTNPATGDYTGVPKDQGFPECLSAALFEIRVDRAAGTTDGAVVPVKVVGHANLTHEQWLAWVEKALSGIEASTEALRRAEEGLDLRDFLPSLRIGRKGSEACGEMMNHMMDAISTMAYIDKYPALRQKVVDEFGCDGDRGMGLAEPEKQPVLLADFMSRVLSYDTPEEPVHDIPRTLGDLINHRASWKINL